MTNQQLYLSIALPTLSSLLTLTIVCLAWLSGRASDRGLRTEMRELRMDMERRFERLEACFEARFDAIDAELRYFHGTIGNHDAHLTLLEKK